MDDKQKEKFKQELAKQLSFIRGSPKSYIHLVEEQRTCLKGNILYIPGHKLGARTLEGEKAYLECIDYLNSQKPIGVLQYDEEISKASQDHADDMGQNGLTDHFGSDNSVPTDRVEKYIEWDGANSENLVFGVKNPEQVIIDLIVDDGIPHRYNRAIIFDPKLKYIGVGVCSHPVYNMCTVLNYVEKISSYHVKTNNKPLAYELVNWKNKGKDIKTAKKVIEGNNFKDPDGCSLLKILDNKSNTHLKIEDPKKNESISQMANEKKNRRETNEKIQERTNKIPLNENLVENKIDNYKPTTKLNETNNINDEYNLSYPSNTGYKSKTNSKIKKREQPENVYRLPDDSDAPEETIKRHREKTHNKQISNAKNRVEEIEHLKNPTDRDSRSFPSNITDKSRSHSKIKKHEQPENVYRLADDSDAPEETISRHREKTHNKPIPENIVDGKNKIKELFKKLIKKNKNDDLESRSYPSNISDISETIPKIKRRNQQSVSQFSDDPYAPEGAVSCETKIRMRKKGNRLEKKTTNTYTLDNGDQQIVEYVETDRKEVISTFSDDPLQGALSLSTKTETRKFANRVENSINNYTLDDGSQEIIEYFENYD